MAYVLLNSQFEEGLQSNTALLLQSLRQITLVSPFNIVDVRTQLETSQIQPFSDDAFVSFLTQIYALDLDYSALTTTEQTVLNVIREYIQPAPYLACCGTLAPTLPRITLEFNPRIGSATFEHEVRIKLDPEITCDIVDISFIVAPASPSSPAVITATPFIVNNLGCVSGENVFSYLWVDFASNPSGSDYDIQYDFRDYTGTIIYTLSDLVII